MNIRDCFKKKKNLPLFTGIPDSEPVGNYVGKVDARQEFVLTCTGVIPLYEGYFVKIYQFKDDDGNVVVNFASKDGCWFPGERYRIRARVKRHSIYNGVKQTQIIRLTTVELIYIRDESDKVTGDASWNAI